MTGIIIFLSSLLIIFFAFLMNKRNTKQSGGFPYSRRKSNKPP